MDKFLKQIIKEAGELARGYFEQGVQHISSKSNVGDLVTEADVAVSNFLIGRIQKEYPDHQITSEERDEPINPGGEFEWVIDPIDGTRNFAMGIPLWCVIIAVVQNGETILGAVYLPISNQLFFAEKGKGAYLDHQRIHVNNTDSLGYSFGVVSAANEAGTYGDYIERFRVVMMRLVSETTVWVHSYGTAVSTCFVASGGVDFKMGNAGLDWDYLAPHLICEEAGAVVTDSYGNPWKRGRQDHVIANPNLHPKVMELFEK